MKESRLRRPPATRATSCSKDAIEAARVETHSTASSGLPARRALVVGADSATLQLCRDALESSGFAADAVDSGIAAVVAARESPPDLVLVDVQLRDVPGREAIGWLRSNPALQSTPIIFLTTNAEDDVVPTLARQYASLPKPVSPAAIRRTIREVLDEVSRTDRPLTVRGGAKPEYDRQDVPVYGAARLCAVQGPGAAEARAAGSGHRRGLRRPGIR
jgi:CheY-like chemotaxis protein